MDWLLYIQFLQLLADFSSFTHTPPNRCDGQDCPDEERGIHPVG
jgi:hypothetical protein